MKIGVIGAGMAGGYLGSALGQLGHEVVVFEKSRGFGGRLATRRGEGVQFDHGAPFFTARTALFKELLAEHASSVMEWTPRITTLSPSGKSYKRDWFEPHYIGVPAMGALAQSLLATSEVQFEREVGTVVSEASGCLVQFKDGAVEPYDLVISTAPAPQTAAIMSIELEDVSYSPCFALLAIPCESQNFDAAVVKNSPIEWIECTASKPSRVSTLTLVAHASAEWTAEHFDAPRDDVKQFLVSALAELGLEVESGPSLHRWRYAQVVQPYHSPYWLSSQSILAACGDWGVGPGVESAVISASKLVAAIAARWPLNDNEADHY